MRLLKIIRHVSTLDDAIIFGSVLTYAPRVFCPFDFSLPAVRLGRRYVHVNARLGCYLAVDACSLLMKHNRHWKASFGGGPRRKRLTLHDSRGVSRSSKDHITVSALPHWEHNNNNQTTEPNANSIFMTGILTTPPSSRHSQRQQVVVKVPYRETRQGQQHRRRFKQVSHGSTSSFFSRSSFTGSNFEDEEHVVVDKLPNDSPKRERASVNSSPETSSGSINIPTKVRASTRSCNQHETSLLPGIPERPSQPYAQQSPCPLQVVQAFVERVRSGQIHDAAKLLDPSVQVSYVGEPFCASAPAWVTQQQRRRQQQTSRGVWQCLQVGAHAHQVVRRGQVDGQAVVEVFELHPAEAGDGRLCIGAMYLRRAPSQWIGSRRRGRGNRRSTGSHVSLTSQRHLQQMLRDPPSDHDRDLTSSSDDPQAAGDSSEWSLARKSRIRGRMM